ncbi:uncharacterized protein LOC115962235 isoform X2 [Quercus lobata]|uniref:uncharacterized protein LOC115962235 isoform X2 n=1 Tax=Quercus lobata TaxID=97700 RepID=UPI001244FFE1|nr:uncharacterized protein LOC115962235 isoform X2 [Quercus lobata]
MKTPLLLLFLNSTLLSPTSSSLLLQTERVIVFCLLPLASHIDACQHQSRSSDFNAKVSSSKLVVRSNLALRGPLVVKCSNADGNGTSVKRTVLHDLYEKEGQSPWFLPMSETSNYYSSTSGHLCDLDHCTLRTSLKLHTFGRRFYGCHYWSPGDDRACKFFKWLDTKTCMCGAVTTPIVLAKFRRLENEVELANEELKQARAMGEAAKRKAKRAKVTCRIFEEKVEKFKIALVISWVMFGVLLILSTRFKDVRSRQMYLPG